MISFLPFHYMKLICNCNIHCLKKRGQREEPFVRLFSDLNGLSYFKRDYSVLSLSTAFDSAAK